MTKRALAVIVIVGIGCKASNQSFEPAPGSPDMAMTLPPTDVDMAMSSLAPDMAMSSPAPDMVVIPPDPCGNSSFPTGWDFSCGSGLGGDPNRVYHCYQRQTIWTDPCPAGCHVSPNGVPDYCEAPAGPPPPKGNGGKGLWIWDMDVPGNPNPHAHAPDPQTIADMCASLGIGFVLIKSGEDDSFWDWNFNAATIKPFLDKSIEVYAWPYVRPGNAHFGSTQSHIDYALKAAAVPGVKGIIVDVEEEFKRTYTYPGDPAHDPRTTYGADATALCKGIRAGLSHGMILGYSTFGWVYLNTSFPYSEFDTDCGDAFLPQTYYVAWKNVTPQKAYDIGCGGATALGLSAPCWAAQDNCESTGQASAQNLTDFFSAAGNRGSLWRLYNDAEPANGCPVNGKTLNDQIKALSNWKN